MVLKVVIAGVLLAHGIGHVLFLAPTLRVADWAGQSGHSWALAPAIGEGLARGVTATLWIGAVVLFVVAAGGYAIGADSWRTIAVVGAVVSGLGIVLSWGGIATSNAFFAIVVDAVVVSALFWAGSSAAAATGD